MKNKLPTPAKIAINIFITLVFAAIYFYFGLPAINIKSPEFWQFAIITLVFFTILNTVTTTHRIIYDPKTEGKLIIRDLWNSCKIPLILVGLCLAFCLIFSILSAVIFNSSAYSSLIEIKEGNFTEDVTEISYDQIPMLDGASANALANRKLGELSDLVSQFEVNGESAQINYNDRPVRVSYLNYGDFFKWFNNQSSGIPAYMVTDMVTQEVTVVRTESGIKYSPSEYFNRNIMRHLRFNFPTFMFDDVNFEIDEEGTPYFVASVLTKRIMVFGGNDIKGAVLVNALTGECSYYDAGDVPQWVDRVFSAELLIEQYNYYGTYQGGFWNSIFGQTGCTVTTEGYNYIAQDDDVWVYTGVTSLGGDESNIGFILVNQRTKDARFYNIAGAEEYSAMDSAQGSVQQYSYEATFPLLLNIEGQPTYFMALKDASSLVKMYAMVNVQQYQIVANGYSLSECQQNYQNMLLKNGIIEEEVEPEPEIVTVEVTGSITDIRSAVINGTTYYYFTIGEKNYKISASDSETAIFAEVGDEITLVYNSDHAEDAIISAKIK